MSYNCPKKQNQQTPQRQNSCQRPSNNRKVNHVSSDTTYEAPEVMLGTFDVHSTPATILFDSGDSHTFISQIFVKMHSIPLTVMKESLLVSSPRGTMQANHQCLPISLILRGVEFKITPIVLRTSGTDVILGIYWMMQSQAVIQC
jgi:hypothetical protein